MMIINTQAMDTNEMKGAVSMRIVEQSLRVTERTRIVKTDHPADSIFQVFVKGKLQDRGTYTVTADAVDFGYDCLVAGDTVQFFFFLP